MTKRTGYLLKVDDEVSVVVETPKEIVKRFSVELGDPQQRAVAKRDIPALRRKPDGLYRITLEPYKSDFAEGWTITDYAGIDETEELNALAEVKGRGELSKALAEMVGLEDLEDVETLEGGY